MICDLRKMLFLLEELSFNRLFFELLNRNLKFFVDLSKPIVFFIVSQQLQSHLFSFFFDLHDIKLSLFDLISEPLDFLMKCLL
jgi:hypothetical protein